MSKLYLGSIDLNKINKADIVTKDKDGNTFASGAKYLNIAQYINDEPDKFGNDIAIKAGSKENSYYIGNAKEWKQKDGSNQSNDQSTEDDDLPF